MEKECTCILLLNVLETMFATTSTDQISHAGIGFEKDFKGSTNVVETTTQDCDNINDNSSKCGRYCNSGTCIIPKCMNISQNSYDTRRRWTLLSVDNKSSARPHLKVKIFCDVKMQVLLNNFHQVVREHLIMPPQTFNCHFLANLAFFRESSTS